MNDDEREKSTRTALLEFGVKRCTAGLDAMCEAIASALFGGQIAARDAPRGLAMLGAACERGHGRSCGLLGRVLYERRFYRLADIDVTVDKPAAARHLATACLSKTNPSGTKAGDQEACALLGVIKVLGDGVEADIDGGRTLLLNACGHDVWRACVRGGELLLKAGDAASETRGRKMLADAFYNGPRAMKAEAESVLAANPGPIERRLRSPAEGTRQEARTCDRAEGRKGGHERARRECASVASTLFHADEPQKDLALARTAWEPGVRAGTQQGVP